MSKIPLTLDDLLKPKVRVVKAVRQEKEVVASPIVQGVYKIPESDKPFSIYFAKEVVTPRVNLKPKTWKENIFAITAMLSKFPHFEYVQSCKVEGHPKTYWFKDNSCYTLLRIKELPDRTDIQISKGKIVVLTESEVNRKIKF